MELNDGITPPKDNRMMAVALCAVAGLLLVFSCITHRWLELRKSRNATFGISLYSAEICATGDYASFIQEGCHTMGNGQLVEEIKQSFQMFNGDPNSDNPAEREMHDAVRASGVFKPMGLITLALLGLAALALLGSAALALLKKRVTFPIMPTTVALLGLMTSLITGCVFVATKPGVYRVFQVGVGIGFWAFGIGAVVGIAGAQMAAKLIKPIDPDITTEQF